MYFQAKYCDLFILFSEDFKKLTLRTKLYFYWKHFIYLGFSQKHKIGNIGIYANFLFPNICSSQIFVVYFPIWTIMLVNVKLDLSVYKRITFQDSRLHCPVHF